MAELWRAVGQLFLSVVDLLSGLQPYALGLLVLIAWIAWWLWAVNWPRAWEYLAAGAWVPLVLLMIVAALVWSQLAPVPVLNFWTHLGGVALLVGLALFCGWLQGVMRWTPAEITLEPAAPEHGHAPNHGHEPVPHHEAGDAHPHH